MRGPRCPGGQRVRIAVVGKCHRRTRALVTAHLPARACLPGQVAGAHLAHLFVRLQVPALHLAGDLLACARTPSTRASSDH